MRGKAKNPYDEATEAVTHLFSFNVHQPSCSAASPSTSLPSQGAFQTMTQQATITGHVTYTPGDGAPLTIPKGPVELDFSVNSVTLSWTADNGAVGAAAIPLDTFERCVHEGKIEHTIASGTPSQVKADPT